MKTFKVLYTGPLDAFAAFFYQFIYCTYFDESEKLLIIKLIKYAIEYDFISKNEKLFISIITTNIAEREFGDVNEDGFHLIEVDDGDGPQIVRTDYAFTNDIIRYALNSFAKITKSLIFNYDN